MPSKEMCYQNIRMYQNAKQNINSICGNLDSMINTVNTEKRTVSDSYLVDNNITPIVNRMVEVIDDANKISNYLKNTILSAIDAEIAELYRIIARIEEEERRLLMMNNYNGWW